MSKPRCAALLLPVVLGLTSPAMAQDRTAGGRTVYEAGFFTVYSPASALDIVRRVPGFTLDLGSQDVRGFGQAAGNVVINGARPSSKADTLETILARIPAANVVRVEAGPGDLFGSEFSGKPQVLNLVLTSAGGLSGTVTATIRRDFSGQLTPEGDVSALYRRGPSSFNLSAGYTNTHTPEEGTDTVRALPGGALTEFRRKYNDIGDHEAYVSGSWEHDGGEYRTARLNFRAARGAFELFQRNHVVPSAGPERNDRLSQDFRRRDYELGGDVTRPLLGGGLKLIGLATRKQRLNEEISLRRIDGETVGGSSQDSDLQRNETVLRLVWSRQNVGGWNVELGGEAALNTLDSDTNLYALDAGGGRTRIDLPVDQAKVKEWRGEMFANAGRSLSPSLRMDLGLVYEISRLTVRGDTEAERSLRFLKPKAVFDWKKGKWHAQLSIARTVAQLNFDDFVSSAELANDRVDAGNADLVPQRAWETQLTVERPILGDGLAKLELGYNRISLVQDRVPLPEGFDAPGNLGSGRLMFARGTLTLPLGRLGIKGGRIDATGMLQETSVRDPYTDEKRRFSGFTSWSFETSFRQDLGSFGWGFTIGTNPATPFFWRDEIDTSNGKEPFVTAFAEYRPSRRTTITIGIDNIFQMPGDRLRLFFEPDRSSPSPASSEYRERNPHITTYIKLKRSFG